MDAAKILRPLMVDRRVERIEEVISRRLWGITVLLEELSDHGNTVAIMRTCEALGIQNVHLVELDGEYKPAKKIGKGADKWLTIHVHKSSTEAAAVLTGQGYRLLAAELAAPTPLEAIELSDPVALVFGGEKEGITPELSELCDGSFRISMVGHTQSLNVSCAAAISLYAVANRYRKALGQEGDLAPDQAAVVRELFYRRSVRASELLVPEQEA